MITLTILSSFCQRGVKGLSRQINGKPVSLKQVKHKDLFPLGGFPMNAKKLLLVTLLLAILLSACASQSTETPREEPVVDRPAAEAPVVVEV
jgi:hypothetical protein